jgi:hypothetical protein
LQDSHNVCLTCTDIFRTSPRWGLLGWPEEHLPEGNPVVTTTISPSRPDVIQVQLPEPFSSGWNRIPGVHVQDCTLSIDPGEYFFRYDNPRWLLVDWPLVRDKLLPAEETTEVAVEQQTLNFVKTHGRHTTDPAAVLCTAWEVYSYIFREAHLTDPGLAGVTVAQLRMLREMGTVMALNRVELDGEISNVGPAWMFPATCRVVHGLDEAEAEQVDELYHGTWFNEPRRIESVKAHAALGGRLVHGCQSRPNLSGGVVAPYGCDITAFKTQLAAFRTEWIERVLALGEPTGPQTGGAA